MLGAENRQVVDAGHRAVRIHDLADHAGRRAASEPRHIDRGLGLAGALEDATGPGAQREDVTRRLNVVSRGLRINGDAAGRGAISSGDAGRDALLGLNRDREGGLVRRHVVRNHRAQAQLVAAVRRERQADEATGVRRHEVDVIRRDELGGHAQVSLVLAVRGVDDDDHLAIADILDCCFDRAERGIGLMHGVPC